MYRIDFYEILRRLMPNKWRKTVTTDFLQSAFKGLEDVNKYDSRKGFKDMALYSTWDSVFAYSIDDLVSWENKVYKSLTNSNSGNNPFSSSANWESIGDSFSGLSATRDEIEYVLRFTGQAVYLQHFLNDQFDNISRGIYINCLSKFNQLHITNKADSLVLPVYLFNKWDSIVNYSIGHYVSYNGAIHRSLSANLNKQPDTYAADWTQVWSGTVSYSIGDGAILNKTLYKSKTNGNVNNNPASDFTNWEIEAQPTYMKNKTEFGVSDDYEIYVPSALWAIIDQDNFVDKVNKYNPAGKVYTIKTY